MSLRSARSRVWSSGTERCRRRPATSSPAPRELADAGALLTWGRGHWSIENRSHYVRDVTLGEDASRIRKGGGPEIMAALRNAAIGFLRATGATNIAETIRRNASQVRTLFTKLGIFKK